MLDFLSNLLQILLIYVTYVRETQQICQQTLKCNSPPALGCSYNPPAVFQLLVLDSSQLIPSLLIEYATADI